MMSRRIHELKSSKGSGRKDKIGSTKKAERTPAAVFNGWDLPFVQDENDIVNWMVREKNGDNKRKPRPNEELPEEGYRHDFMRCTNVENSLEFERESLHERYRKNWQVGAMAMELRDSPNLKKVKEELADPLPARKLRFPRSCKSAELPSTSKISTLQQVGLGFPDSENAVPLMLSRSYSVIDDARLKAYGLTLPRDEKTLRLLQLAEKFTSKADRGERKANNPNAALEADEGYDSKVSSNDNDGDDDVEGSKVVQHDGSSVYTNLESILPDQAAIDAGDVSSTHNDEDGNDNDNNNVDSQAENTFNDLEITQNLPQKLLAQSRHIDNTQKDSLAKLMYSRRDLNVYERSPSRRKDNSFKYAGKEQSRLMETSLNNITPGYLNMQQLANLTSLSQNPTNQINIDSQNQLQLLYRHYAQQQHNPPHHHHHHHQHHHHYHHHNNSHQPHTNQNVRQFQNPQQSDSTDQKQLALRQICLQDTNNSADNSNSHTIFENQKLLLSHNTHSGSPSINNSRRIKSSGSDRDEPIPEESIPNTSSPYVNGAYNSENKDMKTKPHDQSVKQNLLRVQDMSSKITLPTNNRIHGIQSYNSNGDNRISPTSRESPENDTTAVKPKETGISSSQNGGHGYNQISPVLLKYYNKNSPIGFTDNPKSEEGTGAQERVAPTTFFPVADLLPAVENNLRRRRKRGLGKQQAMYRSHTMLDSNLWKKDALNHLHGVEYPSASYHDISGAPAMMFGDRQQMAMQKAYGLPRFRPHHALSPLQRAKEIANRRLHGHLATYPDGSEAIRVSSPQYNMSSRRDRINSASRQLGKIIKGSWKAT